MTDLTPLFDQIHAQLTQMVPHETLTRVIFLTIVFLAVGIVMSVLGAKMAKPAITGSFGLLGAALGVRFGHEGGYSAPLCALVAAAMFATVAHLTFRTWVGLATGVVVALVTLSTFGYSHVAPHVADFDRSGAGVLVSTDGLGHDDAPLPSVLAPQEWATQFWTYLQEKDASVAQEGKLLAVAAMVVGLFLGVIAVRWMLILTTSVVGTALVVSAVGIFLNRFFPGSHHALVNNPAIVGVGVGGFLLTSLIVQLLLTRTAPAASNRS